MMRKSRTRFSRAEIALFIIPLFLPVVVKVALVIKEESKSRYMVWDHGIPSWRKSSCCGLKQIGLDMKQYQQDYPYAARKKLK